MASRATSLMSLKFTDAVLLDGAELFVGGIGIAE